MSPPMTLTARYRVKPGSRVSLAKWDPADTADLQKKDAEARLPALLAQLEELQNRLYAADQWAVLTIFQAMDGAGKDSVIKRVMTSINPQGLQVFSFKVPSDEELDHDYLWRTHVRVPERGRVGVHNRSHYEEVVVTRVHPEIVLRQRMPGRLPRERLWPQRFREINEFERHLYENGTLILKFFLHVSKEEQRRRFLRRMDEPEKHWKFSPRDVRERTYWDRYMAAYEEAIGYTSTEWAPWFIVPADRKWFTRLAVAEILADAMKGLKLSYPTIPAATKREWTEVRKLLTKT